MLSGVPWWSDDPISTFHDDRLQRGPFAKQVAAVLDQVGAASATSTVVAVTGPWGSGKTSILKLALSHLKLTTWKVAWLNPWALSGPDAITHELIASIASVMPKDRASKRLRKALYDYSEYATPFLPIVPGGDALKSVYEVAVARRDGNSLTRMAEDISNRLKASPHRILIVIDDLDRLQPDELLALFKSVRVLGRLPNVHYLLAFDQDTLLHVLTKTSLASGDEARALAFLEKLVTVRLDQPPIRDEQSDELLQGALLSALAAASITPTDDQARRLSHEREELLVPLLTEPRKITRYAAQLHSYLPLVNAEELDLVDFLVLTYLRLAFPRLYEEIANDQDVLTAHTEPVPRLDAWGDRKRVADVIGTSIRDPERTCERIHDAITRLFPDVAPDDAAVVFVDREQRRRDRRASDPDYVNRYFALNSEAEPIPDATLTAALHQWATRAPATESRAVLDALLPPNTALSVTRVLRRLAARNVDLDDTQAGQAAAFILEQGDVFAATITARDASVNLLAQLVSRTPSDPTLDVTILNPITQTLGNSIAPANLPPPSAATTELFDARRWPFTTLVAAVQQPGWRPTPNATTGDDRDFLHKVADVCIGSAWSIVEHDLSTDDQAPLHGATVALRLLDETWGPSEVDRRLVAHLNSGTELDTLAARYVDIGTDQATGQQSLVGFNAEAFGERFGRSRVEAARQRLVTVGAGPHTDEDDITWPNRRAVAAHLLVEWLNSPHHRAQNVTPLTRSISRIGTDLTSGFLPTGGANLPDLQVAVRFHLGGTPGTEPSHDNLPTDAREQSFLQAAQSARLNDWLTRNKAAWRLTHVTNWTITEGHPHLWTQAECHAEGPRDGSQSTVPIRIKMKSEVGTGDRKIPALQLAVLMSFRMSGLEGSRQPAPRTYDEKPLPAALTVAELHEALVVLLNCRENARHLWADQWPSIEIPTQGETQIAMWSRSGMSRSIDLRQYPFTHTTEHALYEMTYITKREDIASNTWSQTPHDGQAASAAIKEWAELEGYRSLNDDLTQIEQRRTP